MVFGPCYENFLGPALFKHSGLIEAHYRSVSNVSMLRWLAHFSVISSVEGSYQSVLLFHKATGARPVIQQILDSPLKNKG